LNGMALPSSRLGMLVSEWLFDNLTTHSLTNCSPTTN
jgi:hypothetical protein